MRRWYNTWMSVNLRPDARFEVTLAPIKHLTTDLRAMPKAQGRIRRVLSAIGLLALFGFHRDPE